MTFKHIILNKSIILLSIFKTYNFETIVFLLDIQSHIIIITTITIKMLP